MSINTNMQPVIVHLFLAFNNLLNNLINIIKNWLPQRKIQFCGICFDLKPESNMFIENCNHPFCTHCISNYAASKIQQNILFFNCPDLNCSVQLKPEHLRHILPNEVIDRWEAARCELSIDGSQKFYCPFQDCSALLVKDEEGMGVTSSECPYCYRLFCAQCKVPWHAEKNCKQFQQMKEKNKEKDLDGMFKKLATREKWRKCPKCSITIQRHSGCEHMTCSRCRCEFCYYCGKNWSGGHLCK